MLLHRSSQKMDLLKKVLYSAPLAKTFGDIAKHTDQVQVETNRVLVQQGKPGGSSFLS